VVGLSVDLRRREETLRLVSDISLSLSAAETLGVVGESGSGKSVTAMSIIRLLPPALHIAEGSVRFKGRDLTSLSSKELRDVRGKEVGVVFQDPQNSLDPSFTIQSQMVETMRSHLGLNKREARARAISLLDRVGIPNAARRIRDYPHQLSGGMAQRAMIALAISCEPSLLIADEPTTALDVTVQAQILSLLRSLQEEKGMSLLLISHDLGVIAEMADRMVVMYAGEIVERGDVVETLTKPKHPYTEALLRAQPSQNRKGDPLVAIPGMVPNADAMPSGCRFSPRCRHVIDRCALEHPTLDEVLSEPAARCLRAAELDLAGVATPVQLNEEPRREPGKPGERETILRVEGLGKKFSLRSTKVFGRRAQLTAVDDVGFALRAGETIGLVGESGAGKSTVGRLILGLVRPTSGSIEFRGHQITRGFGRRRDLRRDVQVVFQNPYASLDPMMTIEQTLSEPLEVHLKLDRAARRRRVLELLEQVGLSREYADRYPHALSGGQRQRIAIARALALNPMLIVCDEPVSSLDVSSQAQVINLLRDLQQRLGISYVFVGHDLSVVYQISHRVAVMFAGKIVEMGPAEDVYRNPQHPYTRTLLDAVLAVDPRARSLGTLVREKSEPRHEGCVFAHRCEHAHERCLTPPPSVATTDGRVVSCWLYTDSTSNAQAS
jgi:oligopeptide/dipeptide ABC transporter ATP-binding protein